MVIFFLLYCFSGTGQSLQNYNQDSLIHNILQDPSPQEIKEILDDLRKQDLSPQAIEKHDSIVLSNSNELYILSHQVGGLTHFGAVIVPANSTHKKLPIMILATGGDGMHQEFNISQDFNHPAVQFPSFLGESLDKEFMVVIPSFRGQQLIIGDKKYQSEGKVSDAFDGATSDALAFLNVALQNFKQADESRIAICGGSRGGTVALLAAARDQRISKAIVVAAPTDMKALYQLYPDQFKLLFFNDFLAGKISEQEARKKFISTSPIYFLDELPPVQIHHDQNDPFVPVSFAQSLSNKMKAQGKSIDAHFYNEGIHGFWSDQHFWERVQAFIQVLAEQK